MLAPGVAGGGTERGVEKRGEEWITGYLSRRSLSPEVSFKEHFPHSHLAQA